jgi:predicted GIY-YIG superfamily endonuclease
MAWYVYILLCDRKSFYIGITDDLDKRFSEHRGGSSPYTKRFSEIEPVYREEFKSHREAELREQQLKKWSVAKKKALIEGRIADLKKLSKGPEVGDSHASRKW